MAPTPSFKVRRPAPRASGKYKQDLPLLQPATGQGWEPALWTTLGTTVLDQGCSEVSRASRQDRGAREGEGAPDLRQGKLGGRADGCQGRGWEKSTLPQVGSNDVVEDVGLGCVGDRAGRQFATTCSLMVQDVGDIRSLKILHLQDPVKMLQPLVIVGQVRG